MLQNALQIIGTLFFATAGLVAIAVIVDSLMQDWPAVRRALGIDAYRPLVQHRLRPAHHPRRQQARVTSVRRTKTLHAAA